MNISEDYKEKQRDKLVELLEQANEVCSKRFREETKAVLKQKGCFNSKTDRVENFNEITADYLIESGVICPPCKVNQEVYLIVTCKEIPKFYDNDYISGTGAVECPLEFECTYEECKDAQLSVVCDIVTTFFYSDSISKEWEIITEDGYQRNFSDFGKTVFLTKEEAEKALKGWFDT